MAGSRLELEVEMEMEGRVGVGYLVSKGVGGW